MPTIHQEAQQLCASRQQAEVGAQGCWVCWVSAALGESAAPISPVSQHSLSEAALSSGSRIAASPCCWMDVFPS